MSNTKKVLTAEQKAKKAKYERERIARKKAEKKSFQIGSKVSFVSFNGTNVSGKIEKLSTDKRTAKTYAHVIQDGKVYSKLIDLLK